MKLCRGLLALAGVALLALAVACGAPGKEPRSTPTPTPPVSAYPSGASGAVVAMPGMLAPTPGPRLAYGALAAREELISVDDRMTVRTIDMTLVVPGVWESLQEVSLLAQEMGGFVVSSYISGEEEASTSATISIRVPEERVGEALGRLRGMAVRVPSERSNARDVTEEYVDLGARLQNLEATEEQLTRLMERAEKVEEVLQVQRELTSVRGQIESIKGRMQYLERTSAMSLITLRLLPVANDKPLADPGWSALETVKAAVRGLADAGQRLADMGIWLAIFSPFWVPPAVVAGWAGRRLALRLMGHTRQEGQA